MAGCRGADHRRARTAVPAAWAQMIDSYLVTLSAAGRPRTTMTLRRIQLVRMARELGVAPSEVTGESFRPLPRGKASTSLEARSFGELAADDVAERVRTGATTCAGGRADGATPPGVRGVSTYLPMLPQMIGWK